MSDVTLDQIRRAFPKIKISEKASLQAISSFRPCGGGFYCEADYILDVDGDNKTDYYISARELEGKKLSLLISPRVPLREGVVIKSLPLFVEPPRKFSASRFYP